MTVELDETFKQLQKDFLEEASFLLAEFEESYLKLEGAGDKSEELSKIFRIAHSVKGAGAAVGFTGLANFAHKVEDCLSVLRNHPDRLNPDVVSLLLRSSDALKERVDVLKTQPDSPWDIDALAEEVLACHKALESNSAPKAAAPTRRAETKDAAPAAAKDKDGDKKGQNTIKIESGRVDVILDLVGELVVMKSQLINQTESYTNDLRLSAIVGQIDKSIRELQDKTLSLRMTPLKPLFLKTQRIARDLSLALNKTIEVKIVGDNVEIDRFMLDLLGDPLVHIVRNSLDHGLEPKDKRMSAGKDETGHLTIEAQKSGSRVLISVRDDGGGIKKRKVFEKAKERGIMTPDRTFESCTEKEILSLIFEAGFSTAEKVSDVSGRGVGMDVVRTNIEAMKGQIIVESVEGEGTCITLSLPITTSITDGMIVNIQKQIYIVPLDNIVELINQDSSSLIPLDDGRSIVKHRNHNYPLSNFPRPNGSVHAEIKKCMYLLLESDKKKFTIQVEQVLGQTQVVTKPLDAKVKTHEGITGAAILGDGRIGFVIDPYSLCKKLEAA